MNEAFIIFGVIGAVWALFLIIRAPSVVLFLSLLVGQLLASQASQQIYDWINPIVQIKDLKYLQLALLLLPLILTLAILHGRVTKPRLAMEAIPYVFVAAAGVLFASEYSWILDQKVNLAQNQFGDYKTVIIIAASVSSLITAWINYPKHGRKHHRKHF